ncbi:MAG: hypothetical protein R3C17_08910 [Planctomycetaceae bacterium]
MAATIDIYLTSHFDECPLRLKSLDIDLSRSKICWKDGPASSKEQLAPDRSAEGKLRVFIRILVTYKLGLPDDIGHFVSQLKSLRLKPAKSNQALKLLGGTHANGIGRLRDLFVNPEPSADVALEISGDMLPDDNLQIWVRRCVDDEFDIATIDELKVLRAGIHPTTGKLVVTAPQARNDTTEETIELLPTGQYSKRSSMNSPQSSPKVTKPAGTPTYDDEAASEHVFDNVINEIEKILNRGHVLRQFLADSTTRFIENRTGHWCVTEEVKARGFKLEPILEGIADRVDDLVGDLQEWKSLGEVAGGLAVLGLDRSWIARHIANSRTATAEFPAYDEIIGVGDDKYVNLLHLVTCGLADGMARLEKLFGEPPLDDRRLPDTAVVNKGSMPFDIEKEIRLFLIRNVLGRREKIIATNDSRVKIQFKQVKRKLANAFKNHVPYYGSSPQYRELTNLLRIDLQLEDLLLIFPSGDDPELDPEELVPDNISVFEALGRIFDAVQANTGMQS